MTTAVTDLLADLNATYAKLHTAKEDAFWTAKMGLADDVDAASRAFGEREIALDRFLQDPERFEASRTALAAAEAATGDDAPPDDELTALRGWVATFEAHGIASAEGRALKEEIVEDEAALGRSRGGMKLGYECAENGFQEATSVELGVMIASDEDEARRKAAWDGMRSIETHVLANGFLDVVRKRNRLARLLGGTDYYDWKVRRVERMSKDEIFALLDELEEETRASAERSLAELRASAEVAVTPWNARYLMSGETTRERDPYFPFAASVERWGRSFAALGIDYAGATMVLDLVDRAGKYSNGFMHGPEVAWREGGARRPARIHFTANAIPGMVGSGHRATQTLFHEGGHAAHFANIDMPAPCFGQEFAPTSVAFAETQSMFLDSLLGDADWQVRYARNAAGEPMPWEIIEKGIRATQPFASWGVRMWLSVCYSERAIYELPDEELTAERVLATIRDVERRMSFLDEGSPRPVLSVPHLLAGESSAYYHGYVLAEMAVHQTRDHFKGRDGHLCDNAKIGPELREHYWRVGNGRGFGDLVASLTGKAPGAAALARHVNRTADEAVADARAELDREPTIPRLDGKVALGGSIRVVHGQETIAALTPDGDFDAFAASFSRWIDAETAKRG